jgi:hypothetical protein
MPTWHETAPSTARNAKQLSYAYGYDSPEALATSLPVDALVVDVGAGRSKFGHTITILRPDIHWVNVDQRNGRRFPLRHPQRKAPPNLQYIVCVQISL